MAEADGRLPSFRVEDVDTTPSDLLVDVLDIQAALPGVQRMRDWARERLGAAPGERALDIGSGTGTEAVDFATRVGAGGEAVGIDPNPAMIGIATGRAAATGSTARFVTGSIYQLPFPDEYFDVIRCERVYQHLTDPAAATAEIARVLRPGGRVMLIDSDWHTAITHPGDQTVMRRLEAAMLAGFPNPASGRRLRGLLSAAGFGIDDIGSQAVIWEPPEPALPLFAEMRKQAVAADVITQQEADQLAAELATGIATGDYLLSVTMFAVLAHKPADHLAGSSGPAAR